LIVKVVLSSPPSDDSSCKECEVRCACGSLLARVINGELELRCRRCKRTVLISLEQLDYMEPRESQP
jgi:phage FluMu protein Com